MAARRTLQTTHSSFVASAARSLCCASLRKGTAHRMRIRTSKLGTSYWGFADARAVTEQAGATEGRDAAATNTPKTRFHFTEKRLAARQNGRQAAFSRHSAQNNLLKNSSKTDPESRSPRGERPIAHCAPTPCIYFNPHSPDHTCNSDKNASENSGLTKTNIFVGGNLVERGITIKGFSRIWLSCQSQKNPAGYESIQAAVRYP